MTLEWKSRVKFYDRVVGTSFEPEFAVIARDKKSYIILICVSGGANTVMSRSGRLQDNLRLSGHQISITF